MDIMLHAAGLALLPVMGYLIFLGVRDIVTLMAPPAADPPKRTDNITCLSAYRNTHSHRAITGVTCPPRQLQG